MGTNELFNLVVKGITKINGLTWKSDKLFIIAGLWVTTECPFTKNMNYWCWQGLEAALKWLLQD